MATRAVLFFSAAADCWGKSPSGYFAGQTPDGRGLWFKLMPQQTNVLKAYRKEQPHSK